MAMGTLPFEQIRTLFIDTAGRLVAETVLAEGAPDHVALNMRKLTALVTALDASLVILAHNHPSGGCSPSKADIATTRMVAALLGSVGASLFDHLIVTRAETFSFRAEGYL